MKIEQYHLEESLSREELDKLQLQRFNETLALAAKSPYYGKIFSAKGQKGIKTLQEVRDLPVTSKEDLRSNYPAGFLTRPMAEMVRLHASSGTTGSPSAVLYTQRDLDNWADLVARSMYMVGIRPEHVFQNLSGYGLFTGGLGIHYGAERLGCLTIPAGAGNSKRQIKLLQDFQVNSMHIIPSYALHLISVFESLGINPDLPHLKVILIGAEPHTEEARQRIQEVYRAPCFNSYGLSEMNGPGVAFECPAQQGMHIWEDAFFPEIVDPETLEPVPEGEVGELVLTSLNREGMPIIRYRTKDLTRFLPGPCPCGRVHRRIDRISGRSDDMIILKGVNIYPMQVERILMSLPQVGNNYLIILERSGYIDQMRIKVEIRDEYFMEEMRFLQGLEKKIAHYLKNEILVTPKVELVQHNSLPREAGKAKRVEDRRY